MSLKIMTELSTVLWKVPANAHTVRMEGIGLTESSSSKLSKHVRSDTLKNKQHANFRGIKGYFMFSEEISQRKN
jgi:hypothetical protein